MQEASYIRTLDLGELGEYDRRMGGLPAFFVVSMSSISKYSINAIEKATKSIQRT